MSLFTLDGHAPEFPASGNYWVAPTAVLIGKVTLQEDASVWFGAVLRGDNERLTIGARSNVQGQLHSSHRYGISVGYRY